MPTTVANLAVIGCIVLLGIQGLSSGLFWATFLAIQFLVPLTLALALFDKLAQLLIMASCPEAWAVFIGFVGVFALAFFVIRRAGAAWIPEDGINTFRSADKLGGLLVAAFAGAVLAGAGLIMWSMLPLAPGLKIDPRTLKLDVGSKALMRFEKLAQAAGADKVFLLRGEPLAKKDDKNAAEAEEPFADLNINTIRDEKEHYIDVNEDKAFTEKLLYQDINKNTIRDLGMLEKYIIGRWTESMPEPLVAPALPATGEPGAAKKDDSAEKVDEAGAGAVE